MKILAFSDLHLGAGQDHRADALADQSRVLEQIAALAYERNVDLILNAGDTFHRAKPAPAELHVFKRFCVALAALGIPMVAIGGNGMHDAAPGQKSALELFESPLVRVSRTPEMIAFPSGGPNQLGVAVCTLPAAALGHLAAAGNGVPRADLAERAVDLLLGCARQLYADAPDDQPRILLAHQMVSGASLPTGLPVEQVGSVVLPLWALEEQGWDAIVLGDIHKAQALAESEDDYHAPIFYCGSPMTHDFGEADVPHGCWLLETSYDRDEQLSIRSSFQVLSGRRFVTVDVDLTQYSSVKGAASHTQEEGPRSPTPGEVRPTLEAPGMRAPNPESNRERSGEGAEHGRAAFGNQHPDFLLARGLEEYPPESELRAASTKRLFEPLQDKLDELKERILSGIDETDLIAAAIAAKFPLTDAVVRVRYRATEEQHRRVDHAALQRLVMDAGAHRLYGGVSWEPVRETRTRAAGLDESLPPLAAVDLWLAANTVDDGQAAALRALLGGWLETV